MPKFRTIAQCYKNLKELDDDCAITIYCLRKWCKQGVIRTINVGNKLLVDYDYLLTYLKTISLKIA